MNMEAPRSPAWAANLLGNEGGRYQDQGQLFPLQPAQNGQAVQSRQDQIKHQDIRFSFSRQPQRLVAVAGGSYDGKTSRFFKGVLQHAAGLTIGIRQHDFYSVVHTRRSFQKFACRHE